MATKALTFAEPAGLAWPCGDCLQSPTGLQVDPRKAEPLLSQARFHKSMIHTHAFKNNPRYSSLTRPTSKSLHTRFVIAKLPVIAIGKPISIQFVFRDIDHNRIVHLSFPHHVLLCGPEAQVSVQVDRKDGGDHTQRRSAMTKRVTVLPPQLPGINAVPGSCSSFSQEPLSLLDKRGPRIKEVIEPKSLTCACGGCLHWRRCLGETGHLSRTVLRGPLPGSAFLNAREELPVARNTPAGPAPMARCRLQPQHD